MPESLREHAGVVNLDRNERLSPLPEEILEKMRAALESSLLTGYPSMESLYTKLSASLGVERERLLLTPGSDAAVKALYQVYAQPGAKALMLDPSYAMYPIYARMFGMEPVQVGFGEDLTVDVDDFVARVQPGVRLIFLANPNQPTGTIVDDAVVETLVSRAAEVGALVVVDEAYFPFSGHTLLPSVAEHRNLVVMRTCSKAWGLAGLRIGFVAADPEVIHDLYRVRSAYDVNAFAAACMEILLDRPEVVDGYAAEVAAGKDVLESRTRELGLEPLPTLANFQLIRLNERRDPGELVADLLRRGYEVKGPFGAPALSDCIRVTLGPPELMTEFADVLSAALGDPN